MLWIRKGCSVSSHESSYSLIKWQGVKRHPWFWDNKSTPLILSLVTLHKSKEITITAQVKRNQQKIKNHYYNIVQCKIICSKPLPFAISFLPSLTCEKECTVKEGSSNTTLFHFTAHGNGKILRPLWTFRTFKPNKQTVIKLPYQFYSWVTIHKIILV